MTDPREELIADLERILTGILRVEGPLGRPREYGLAPGSPLKIRKCLDLIDAARVRGETRVFPTGPR